MLNVNLEADRWSKLEDVQHLYRPYPCLFLTASNITSVFLLPLPRGHCRNFLKSLQSTQSYWMFSRGGFQFNKYFVWEVFILHRTGHPLLSTLVPKRVFHLKNCKSIQMITGGLSFSSDIHYVYVRHSNV